MHDLEVLNIIQTERYRQRHTLRMIASENEPSDDVRYAMSSCFTSKYCEGYPGKRYYQGQENTDKIENIAIERAKKVFNLPEGWHVNVQPYSGSPCNIAAYLALCNIGDKVVGLGLNSGGHLSHGHKANFTGKYFETHQFDVEKDTELIDYDKLEQFVLKVQPKMMIIGTTAYSRTINWKRIRDIADKASCYFVADVAHVAGLIAGGAYPSPIPYADVVTMTTHKTLRGPRGGMIICKPEFAKQIDRAVFPMGVQGGPHMNQIAALAVALHEADTDEFKEYANQIIKNAKKLASVLQDVYGLKIISGGTDSHLIVVDVSSKNIDGKTAAIALEKGGVECSFSTIPYDTRPPAKGSGIRLGTAILTGRGMKEDDMIQVAAYINKILDNVSNEEVLTSVRNEISTWLTDCF